MRIAVVGAGLGGVAAAVGLHRQGHEVTLFERGAELREKGTGIVVMPNGLRALDELFPLGEDQLYWFTDSLLHGPPSGAEEARREMPSLMADWHPLVTALIGATPPEDIYVDPIARLAEPLPSFAVDRIALLGDAAHAMSPDLGQGSSQAFEDAAVLTRHLSGAEPADAVERLLRYDAERRPRANRMMLGAARQSRLTSRTGISAWLRDLSLRAVPSRLATRQMATLWHV
ncbi:FAD-dependent monooxygenase [Nonomuraea sp. NPDC050536]|uniref:FAD-dependent oxidoreductase n=1 Tax=Nonomuraea sp. NPDC050536 TaxID=3364366 RepID=UPI0037C92D3D